MCNDCIRTEREFRARKLQEQPPRDIQLTDVSTYVIRHDNVDGMLLGWYIQNKLHDQTEDERAKSWRQIGSVHSHLRPSVTKAAENCVQFLKRLHEKGYKYSPAHRKVMSQEEINEYLHFQDEK